MRFGDELLNIMVKEGLTKEEVCQKCDISINTLNGYLSNRHFPNILRAYRILSALGYTIVVCDKNTAKKYTGDKTWR